MRFATTVALSTLALAATATAVPVVGDSTSQGTGRGSCHHHGKSHHKKMTPTKCQNIKGATVVGYKSDGNCYDKDMLGQFATLHPSASGTCYYVPSDSSDLDERSIIEARGTKTRILMGAIGAGLLYHALKHHGHEEKHHEEHHEEHHEQNENEAPPPAPSGYEAREYFDFDARDLDAYDYLYGRDYDVLEGRDVGKTLLGAAIGGFAVHEWDKHEKKEKEKEESEEDA